ncbi:hypothetical protein B0H17DRAFT_1154439 [Mycena rosella]|uniref:Uncharacterized protein n=1 Tax=Mycena rosella TaxID=1033263 RepID=A0AAD7AZ08_MYCRO|nr:hypothetical protein B0H17DRAFT_1154439 [Mycena rosella]
MDFVATSQPFEDGYDLFTLPSVAFRAPPSLADGADNADHSESDFLDSVGSLQPFDDGEEDLRLYEGRLYRALPSSKLYRLRLYQSTNNYIGGGVATALSLYRTLSPTTQQLGFSQMVWLEAKFTAWHK